MGGVAKVWRWWERTTVFTAERAMKFHLALTVMWFTIMPLALITGWVLSVVFISVISIYANFVGHFSSWQAARAEESKLWERFHAVLTFIWFWMMPLSIYMGWVEQVLFISVISIYANFAGHFSSWQAARIEAKN